MQCCGEVVVGGTRYYVATSPLSRHHNPASKRMIKGKGGIEDCSSLLQYIFETRRSRPLHDISISLAHSIAHPCQYSGPARNWATRTSRMLSNPSPKLILRSSSDPRFVLRCMQDGKFGAQPCTPRREITGIGILLPRRITSTQ